MSDDNIIDLASQSAQFDPLNDLLQKGARQLIAQAVEAELTDLLDAHASRRTFEDKAAVVRNGYHPERQLQTGIGPVSVRIPKVRARDGKPVSFHSALVPPCVRKTQWLCNTNRLISICGLKLHLY